MATKRKLNATELKFWQAAFLTEKTFVNLKVNGRRRPPSKARAADAPTGAAHLAADRADADLVEFQRRRS